MLISVPHVTMARANDSIISSYYTLMIASCSLQYLVMNQRMRLREDWKLVIGMYIISCQGRSYEHKCIRTGD